MRIRIPLYKTSCLMVIGIIVAIVCLCSCATTVKSNYPDGTETNAKVGFGQTYNTKTNTIESDPRIIEATAKAIVIVAKEAGPEIIDRLSKNALEIQKQQTNN